MCFICGREYGSMSLPIHIKTCSKKWENEQKSLPEDKRKPVPSAPKGFENMLLIA